MDDKTATLLQQLATKLGTTGEYLWGVLVRQAAVSGITDLIQYGILFGCVYGYCKWMTSGERDFESGGDSWPLALLLGVPLGIIVIIAFFCFPNTITAFVNPEYWALKRVLSVVSSN